MHTPIKVDAEPFAFQAVQERLQDVVVVVSQVKVNVERRYLFHALEMPLQLREEFSNLQARLNSSLTGFSFPIRGSGSHFCAHPAAWSGHCWRSSTLYKEG